MPRQRMVAAAPPGGYQINGIYSQGQGVQLVGGSSLLLFRGENGQNQPGLAVQNIDKEIGHVSYTHLRAHETVLDLVCRLMLEKKK